GSLRGMPPQVPASTRATRIAAGRDGCGEGAQVPAKYPRSTRAERPRSTRTSADTQPDQRFYGERALRGPLRVLRVPAPTPAGGGYLVRVPAGTGCGYFAKYPQCP